MAGHLPGVAHTARLLNQQVEFDVVIETDSSGARSAGGLADTCKEAVYGECAYEGFGGISSRGGFLQGTWTEDELRLSINVLEFITVEIALRSFTVKGDSVLVKTDNMAVLWHLRKVGRLANRPLCWLSAYTGGC